MAIGGSVFLILAGVFVATGPGARQGLVEVRYAGLAMAAVGLVLLWLGIMARLRPAWQRERRREAYARARSARRPVPRPRPATAVAKPFVGRYLRQYGRDVEPMPAPTQSLTALGQVKSLLAHTRMPGQHGKRPPSPMGRLKYPV